MLLLDSDVLIDLLNGHSQAIQWLALLTERPVVSGIVKMEVIAGCRNAKEQLEAERLLDQFPTVFTTVADQERALAQFKDVHLRNAIGLADLLIAETAKGLGAALCTRNERHFKSVSGLNLSIPYRKSGPL